MHLKWTTLGMILMQTLLKQRSCHHLLIPQRVGVLSIRSYFVLRAVYILPECITVNSTYIRSISSSEKCEAKMMEINFHVPTVNTILSPKSYSHPLVDSASSSYKITTIISLELVANIIFRYLRLIYEASQNINRIASSRFFHF